MNVWRLLPLVSAPMSFQMALDEVLFRRMEHIENPAGRKPVIRFYFSSEPWVTLGYFSKQTEVQSPQVCRRLTGGGKVVHGEDFIFSLIAHKNDDPSFASVQESYLKIHDTVRGAFEALGFSAEFYDSGENLPKGAECFAYPISSDLKVAGEKIAGGAQKRSSGMLLHHESIRVPAGVSPRELLPALKKSFNRRFGVSFEDAPWNPEILAEAKRLSADGYIPGRWAGKNTHQEAK